MRFYWLRILLLSTFVFWATGAAKYAHEALEHHGRDASVDNDDDDDDSSPAVAVVTAVAPPAPQQDHSQPDHSHQKHPCPVCQMLAAMVLDRSAPPVLPTLCLRLIATVAVADHVAPVIPARFCGSPRGPPAVPASI